MTSGSVTLGDVLARPGGLVGTTYSALRAEVASMLGVSLDEVDDTVMVRPGALSLDAQVAKWCAEYLTTPGPPVPFSEGDLRVLVFVVDTYDADVPEALDEWRKVTSLSLDVGGSGYGTMLAAVLEGPGTFTQAAYCVRFPDPGADLDAMADSLRQIDSNVRKMGSYMSFVFVALAVVLVVLVAVLFVQAS